MDLFDRPGGVFTNQRLGIRQRSFQGWQRAFITDIELGASRATAAYCVDEEAKRQLACGMRLRAL